MVSELSPEVRAKLECLGHNIPDDASVLPLNLRGVTSQQVAILEEHFLRVGPEKRARDKSILFAVGIRAILLQSYGTSS